MSIAALAEEVMELGLELELDDERDINGCEMWFVAGSNSPHSIARVNGQADAEVLEEDRVAELLAICKGLCNHYVN